MKSKAKKAKDKDRPDPVTSGERLQIWLSKESDFFLKVKSAETGKARSRIIDEMLQDLKRKEAAA